MRPGTANGTHRGTAFDVEDLVIKSNWKTNPLPEWVSVYSHSMNKLIRFARRSPSGKLASVGRVLWRVPRSWKFRIRDLLERSYVAHQGNDRTAYVIGLGNSGLEYLADLMRKNIGQRGKYVRFGVRLHSGPTSMIYWGHATMKYASRGQEMPEVTRRMLDAVRSRIADLIFVNRHPLDSLISGWVHWRAYMGDSSKFNISKDYKSSDELCADLDRNFREFKSYAEGDAAFFAPVGGPPFLSFAEYVEETELYLESATLAVRLEDFGTDPAKEFSKIVEVMSVDPDVSRSNLAPPRTKPYRYLEVKSKLPRFRDLIDGLDGATKRRIEKIGYSL